MVRVSGSPTLLLLPLKPCELSNFQVGQRVAPNFSSTNNRVFLAGDAVHTHSPKLGQGMNVSMQDAFNLGWKICSVITGISSPSILETYEQERRPVALELIRADVAALQFFAKCPMTAPSANTQGLREFRDKLRPFLSGVAINYKPNRLIAAQNFSPLSSKTPPALNVKIGSRMPSHMVCRQSDARPMYLSEALRTDGDWRLICSRVT